MPKTDKTAECQPPRLALSIAETAASIGVSRPVVYRLIKEGRLKTVHLGRRQIVTAASLADFLS